MPSSPIRTLIFYAASCLLAGCATTPDNSSEGITVTIEPLRYATEAVAGDSLPITVLTPDGASPETYQPTPRQLTALGRCKAYIRIGTLGFERTQIEKITENMPHLYCVEASAGIRALSDSEETAVTDGDPHVWTSPANMKRIAQNIEKALVHIDPDNARRYADNTARFCQRVDSIDHTIRQYLATAPSRAFLIYHPALAYFAKAYGLQQISIQHDGKEASAERLAALIKQCRQAGVRVVFVQKEYSGNTAKVIADEIGAKVVSINPLSYDWEHEMTHIATALGQR